MYFLLNIVLPAKDKKYAFSIIKLFWANMDFKIGRFTWRI